MSVMINTLKLDFFSTKFKLQGIQNVHHDYLVLKLNKTKNLRFLFEVTVDATHKDK